MGKLADNPELAKAREDVRPGLEKMGEASQWLEKEHERTAGPDVATREEGHGSGRHGARPGWTAAPPPAPRNDFRPTAPRTPTASLATSEPGTGWNWSGRRRTERRTLKDKKVFAQTVLTETYPDQPPAGTTAMFLNPILEKEAVDAALEQAKKCVWKFKANGNPLLELGIAVGKPKSAPDWGYSISKLPREKNRERGRFAPEAVRRGHAHDRWLLEKLNVQIKTDRTGSGDLLVPYAKVVLVATMSTGPGRARRTTPTIVLPRRAGRSPACNSARRRPRRRKTCRPYKRLNS